MSEILAYDHECPTCGAEIGYACVTLTGGELYHPHKTRLDLTKNQQQVKKKNLEKHFQEQKYLQQPLIQPKADAKIIVLNTGHFGYPTEVSAYAIKTLVFQTDGAILFENNEGIQFWIPRVVIVKFDKKENLVYVLKTSKIYQALPKPE